MKIEVLEHQGLTLRKHHFPAEFRPSSGVAPKLAVISAYDCLCGIAEYTYFLVRSLSKFADVTVFELDQEAFKSGTRMAREDAEQLLQMICAELPQYDSVNLQFEPGTLGHNARVAYDRYVKIVDAAPAISVTFHTFLDDMKNSRGFWKEFKRLRWVTAFFGRSRSASRYYITTKPVAYLRNAAKTKRATYIVHTKREVERLVRRHGVDRKNAFDHPLSFLNDEQIAELSESRMIKSLNLASDAVLVGIFGFISEYKGTDLAVDVLSLLPQNYHLLIAGGLHPNESRNCATKLNPYMEKITSKILGTEKGNPNGPLLDRVHFMGAQDRDEFLRIMKDCDVVLLPYREVGQTSSGPISMAVELQKRIIASRTDAFGEFAKYYPRRLELFDQNNFIELGQRIRSPQCLEKELVHCDWRTNLRTYFAASGFSAPSDQQWSDCDGIYEETAVYQKVEAA